MSIEEIILIFAVLVAIVSGVVSIIIAGVKGEIKTFIEEKMVEAEKLSLSGNEKYQYVVDKVKENYKLGELLVNVKKFVEHIIELSKKINFK